MVEEDGRFYSLYPWAPGSQVLRGHLGVEHAPAMGAMLARIHVAFADLPGGPEAADPMTPVEETLERIEKLISIARDRPDRSRNWVIVYLTARAQRLRSHPSGVPAQTTAPSQVIHGDYQDTNLFFEQGRSAV